MKVFKKHFDFVRKTSECELIDTWIDKVRWYKLKCACGNIYEVRMQKFKRKDGRPQIQCQECGKKERVKRNMKTDKEYKQELIDKKIRIRSLEPYQGVDKPIRHECPVCKRNDWLVNPGNILQRLSTKCSECNSKMNLQNQPRTDEWYQKIKIERDIHIINLEPYVNSHTPIKHICPRCGDAEWFVRPAAILKKENPVTMCEPCSYELRGQNRVLSIEEVEKTIEDAGCKWVGGEYTGKDSILKYLCSCGERYFERRFSDLRNGINRCLHCSDRISYGEQDIINYLNDRKVKYIYQYGFDDLVNPSTNRPLTFDFAILNNGQVETLIEYDGQQHYRPIETFGGKEALEKQLERDTIKDNYCKEYNIRLVRIPYWEKENIEAILESVI